MIITTIVNENKVLFEKMVPSKIFEQVNSQGHFGLGAILDKQDDKYSAGVLIFDVDEGTNGAQNLTAAVIKWFYVAEEFRKNGAADALIKEFFRVMDDAGIEHIICDVPMPEEYDFLCAYLEEWGFEFTLANIYEIEAELGEILEKPVFSGPKASAKTIALKEVPALSFRQFIGNMKKRHDVLNIITTNVSDYDSDVSCVYMNGSSVEGAMLIKAYNSGELELLFMRAISNAQKVMADLLLFSAHAAAKKYPPETIVHIICRIEAAASVIQKLFPDRQPLLVRRGYFNNSPSAVNKEV